MNQQNKSIILSLCMLFLWDCSTSTVARSMEFTTAKTSARSEKNLKKAEEYGLQALAMEAHANDASVPYFLAIEIYKPQKNWIKMAEMLDEAIRRNPQQKLETPKPLINPEDITKENVKESIAYTIEEAVKAYRKELWVNLFNKALTLSQKGDIEESMKLFNVALNVNPLEIRTYIVLTKFHKDSGNLERALELINSGLNLENINPFDPRKTRETLFWAGFWGEIK